MLKYLFPRVLEKNPKHIEKKREFVGENKSLHGKGEFKRKIFIDSTVGKFCINTAAVTLHSPTHNMINRMGHQRVYSQH